MSDTSAKLVIRNIGMILTGKMEEPIADGDCLIAIDGKITQWGYATDMDCEGATTEVDAHGAALAPGLIDSHVHPVVGDYTPRQQQLGWIDSTLHGGVTTLISAGEVHMPGRPRISSASRRWRLRRSAGTKISAPLASRCTQEPPLLNTAWWKKTLPRWQRPA